jgi:two-component system, OmpR family, response regulator
MPTPIQKTTILIVDDEPDIRSILDILLTSKGYSTLQADSGKAALEMVAQHHPDLVLLDIIMTDMDGYQVARQLREDPATRELPIIMISARNEDIDEVLGLELGADDYIRKPFEPVLVLARVKACLRRSLPVDQDRITHGKFSIDRNERSIRLGTQDLKLTAAEFDLLWLLASHAGQILSRKDILQATRGLEYDGLDRSIDMRISRLRKLLNDDSTSPKIIKSVRGQGYLFSRRAWNKR